MTQILDVIPNDAEIDAISSPTNVKAADELQQRRKVKKRLDDLLEAAALRRAMGDDF
ncbi:hypothetical protein LZP69_11700 [Shewanella sp. AS1]|uniref:hypothetical protein n=1 Tax=Shewanella sp. AS1 TaxID=2907626 RepID=UPI001F47F773|nr:hypothetical protein [Shewanella sp. AS1]MCE9679826.1 hypothetical protein [Shewanella sp. AS1]